MRAADQTRPSRCSLLQAGFVRISRVAVTIRCRENGARFSGASVSGMRSGKPDQRNDRQQDKAAENAAPAGEEKQRLAQRGGDHGHKDEYRHHKGHDPRHGPPFIAIAYQGQSNRPRRGNPGALQQAPGKHHGEVNGKYGNQRSNGIYKDQSGINRRLAPRFVR